jgi:hypothetical protein
MKIVEQYAVRQPIARRRRRNPISANKRLQLQ